MNMLNGNLRAEVLLIDTSTLSLFGKSSLLGEEPKWGRSVRKCGGQLLCASFGQCGVKEIGRPLIMRPSLHTD